MKYVSSFEPTLIYVMRINDPAHEGCLKIGKASVNYEEASSLQPAPNSNILNQAAKKRINEYTQTAGIAYDLLYTESTLYFSEKRIKAFLDHDVERPKFSSSKRHQMADAHQHYRFVFFE